ncbi:hypothetical protein DIPPA_18106 [Diplonema papillatum]|nr:hypothetical protein DIPPA_18106 [Diplonema papillatum]
MEQVDVAAMQQDLRFYEQERVYLYARVFGCEAAAPGEDWRGPSRAGAARRTLEARVRALRKEFFAAKKQATDAARQLEAAKMDNYRLDAAVAYHERFIFSRQLVGSRRTGLGAARGERAPGFEQGRNDRRRTTRDSQHRNGNRAGGATRDSAEKTPCPLGGALSPPLVLFRQSYYLGK